MKTYKHFGWILVALLLSGGCIGTDVEEEVPEEFRLVVPDNILRVNGRVELTTEFRDAAGTIQEVEATFISADPEIIAITPDNYASGISVGNTTITATTPSLQDSDELLTASLEIAVETSRESLTITEFVSELEAGESFQFDVNYTDVNGLNISTPVIWSASDPSVASISPSGIVTGKQAGMTEITASAGNVTDVITLTVSEGPVSRDPEVRFTSFVNTLKVGDTFTFEASYFDEMAMADESVAIAWQSSNPEIISVSASGTATALEEGSVMITAKGGTLQAVIEVVAEANIAELRTGTLRGTGYDIEGSFTLSENEAGELILSFENASIDRGAPGPYFYLTNQETNVSGGINLGKSRDGNFSINVSAEFPDVKINSFQHVMVWCEPFNVRLGIGTFEN